MNNTTRIAAGITALLISGSAMLIAPLTTSAQTPTLGNQACPGLTIDETCFEPRIAATTGQPSAAACVHEPAGACPTAAIGFIELSPRAMSIDETQVVIDAYLAALVEREDIAPYFSDDVVLELVDVGQRVEGRDEVVAAIVELHEQTFDARPELTNLVVGEGTAAAELVFVGTHTGDFAGIPASGTQVAVPYAAFYELAQAKITSLRIHGFATGLVGALSADAPPASESTAP